MGFNLIKLGDPAPYVDSLCRQPLVAYSLWLMWTWWLERVAAGGCGGRWVWTQPDTCSIVGTALASATVLFGFALKVSFSSAT